MEPENPVFDPTPLVCGEGEYCNAKAGDKEFELFEFAAGGQVTGALLG